MRQPRERVTPRRVLLVEDNQVNQMLLTKLLERQGHAVDVADDGKVDVEMFEPAGADEIYEIIEELIPGN